jgi:hypothetical protein
MKLLGFIFLAAMVGAALNAIGVILGALITKNRPYYIKEVPPDETQVH